MPNINERKDFRYITKKRRVTEDRRFVTGRGNFAADNNLPGTLHVAIVTSPYACAEIKGIDSNNKESLSFLEKNISKGDLNKFKKNTTFIGAELAFNLDLKIGDKINLMSSSFITTPFGGLPKQETLIVTGIFNTGFYEFDQNFVFLNLSDALSIFDKEEYDQNLEIYLTNTMKAD